MVWFTFRDLSDAIDDLMSDRGEVIAEREALLLRELQSMFEEDGLLEQRAARLIKELRAAGSRQDQSSYKLMLLSGKDDERTLRRETPLTRDGPGAWTQGRRYAYSSSILSAETTREL